MDTPRPRTRRQAKRWPPNRPKPVAERSESRVERAPEIVVLAKSTESEERSRTGSASSTGADRDKAKTARSKPLLWT